jgi:hypothetical protein
MTLNASTNSVNFSQRDIAHSAMVVSVRWDSECADIPQAPTAGFCELSVSDDAFFNEELRECVCHGEGVETISSCSDTGLPLSRSAIATPIYRGALLNAR